VRNAKFLVATFKQKANFNAATFTQEACFSDATFRQEISFAAAKFVGSAEFRETRFRQDKRPFPGAIFSLAKFSQPEATIFYKTYLGQALFHHSEVSKLNFSSVEWRLRKGSGKRMVFEEEVDLGAADDLKAARGSPDERDYGLIAEVYQQLKKNYDERKDYWTAGDFHYGEMEMKRLATRRKNKILRWLVQHLRLVACSTAALAAEQTPPPTRTSELSYKHFADFAAAYHGRRWLGRAAFFGNSLMTTLSVAGFQKELKYDPSYPWGRALALLELLLTSTLAALLLLAIRRQFRRWRGERKPKRESSGLDV
jgi:hypothetical protein